MSVTITSAELIAAFPEWEHAPAGVIDNAVAVANALPLPLYSDEDEERHRRYLEASAILYDSPFAREMGLTDRETVNPYREQARRKDVRLGTQYRGPGWTTYSGWS